MSPVASAALAMPSASPIRHVPSAALGMLEVPEDQILTFPGGIPGFPGREQFALVAATRDDVFWLQSCEAPELVFLLADPYTLVPGYTLDLSDADHAAVGAPAAEDVLVLVLVTLPGSETESPLVNLVGPVVVNLHARIGRQVIRGDDHYTTRHPIPLTALLPETLPAR